MGWKVEFVPAARRDLDKLGAEASRRILKFLAERIESSDDARSLGQALKGKSYEGLWRYRVGDYRIIAKLEDGILRVLVIEIGHRRGVYR